MLQIIEIVLCVFMVFMNGPAQASSQWQVSQKKSRVVFILHSTMHEVDGQAPELFGRFEQQENLIKGFVDVGVSGLTTDNEIRDRAMYKMFDASQYAQIHFTFKDVNLANVLEGHEGDVIFSGEMTIHHISHPMSIISTGRMTGNTFICEGQMLISLKDYDLKPPSVLGIIRVKDSVLVQFNIVFSKKGNDYESI